MKSNFEKLRVYQLAENLADEVWELVSLWNQLAKDSVGKQLVRAADSIGANIAEGAGRGSFQDNRRFVRNARGSLYETKHWLRRAYRRSLLTDEQVEKIKPLIEELAPKLNAYLKSIGKLPESAEQLTTDNGPRTIENGELMNQNNQPLIRLEGVTKVFFTDEVETHALAGIHMEINPGEYVSISGPSGCGKSTLLSILGLLDSPTDGSYRLNDKPVENLKPAERSRIRNREIGFIFQAFNLIGDLTVFENVELPLTYRGMPAAERKRRVQEALEKVGMSHRMKHYPSQLSGGQQQRVAVARALGGQPLILLADEPTGNLDSVNGEAVMELLRDLHRSGATICMVTHDPRYARHADRTIRLFDGRVVEETVEVA